MERPVGHGALPPHLIRLHEVRRSVRGLNVESVALGEEDFGEVGPIPKPTEIIAQLGAGTEGAVDLKATLQFLEGEPDESPLVDFVACPTGGGHDLRYLGQKLHV